MTDRTRHRPPTARLPESPPPGATPAEHTHPVPRPVAWSLAALVVASLAGLLLLSAYSYAISSRLTEVEDYIAARGQARDEQAADIRAELRAAVCDVLDRLPTQDPNLAPLRADYGCGPGISPEELP